MNIKPLFKKVKKLLWGIFAVFFILLIMSYQARCVQLKNECIVCESDLYLNGIVLFDKNGKRIIGPNVNYIQRNSFFVSGSHSDYSLGYKIHNYFVYEIKTDRLTLYDNKREFKTHIHLPHLQDNEEAIAKSFYLHDRYFEDLMYLQTNPDSIDHTERLRWRDILWVIFW